MAQHSKTAYVQALKNKLSEVYSEHNPANVSKIDYFMDKYKDQEHLLYESVCKKYKLPSKA